MTNRNLSEVYTNKQLFVASGWSGEYGNTGAQGNGPVHEVCAGPGQALFTDMPTIQQGHNYVLLISHFTPGQSGYNLTFNGGTASITDPVIPEIQNAAYACGIPAITIKLNKKVQCSSLAANGSDFALSGGNGVTITGATGVNCNNGFDMDSIVLTLSASLPAGSYTVKMQTGTDGNSVLDACSNAGGGDNIPPMPFTVDEYQPSLVDHMVPVDCKPGNVQLVMSQPVRCSSIASNGSDFTLTTLSGRPVTIRGASGNCRNGLTDTITILLSDIIYTDGAYQVTLRSGSDGNTLLSECWKETPPGATMPFATKDTVNADFTYEMRLDCVKDSLILHHPGNNGINYWQWTSDGSTFSHEQNPVKSYTVFGAHTVSLVVSNGVCRDSVTEEVFFPNGLKADFSASADILCPQDMVTFTDKSVGENIVSYLWNFGNGVRVSGRDGGQQDYPNLPEDRDYPVQLVVQNTAPCFDTVVHYIKAVASCFIEVPTAFTPNGDGRNDYLYPLNGYKSTNLRFSIYNRLGQLIFETNDWRNKWDGTVGGQPQGVGAYAWILSYTNKDTGEKVFKKGVSVLLR